MSINKKLVNKLGYRHTMITKKGSSCAGDKDSLSKCSEKN